MRHADDGDARLEQLRPQRLVGRAGDGVVRRGDDDDVAQERRLLLEHVDGLLHRVADRRLADAGPARWRHGRGERRARVERPSATRPNCWPWSGRATPIRCLLALSVTRCLDRFGRPCDGRRRRPVSTTNDDPRLTPASPTGAALASLRSLDVLGGSPNVGRTSPSYDGDDRERRRVDALDARRRESDRRHRRASARSHRGQASPAATQGRPQPPCASISSCAAAFTNCFGLRTPLGRGGCRGRRASRRTWAARRSP